MLHVLWLCEYPTLHGGERSALACLPGLLAAGCRITVAAPPAGPLASALAAEGVEVLPLPAAGGKGSTARSRRREELAELIRRLHPAVLHANSLSMGRLSGPVAADSGLASIAHLRDIVGLSRAAVDDLNRHTRLLAVSAATRDYHLAQGLDAGRVHVLYNGVDLERFRPRPPTRWLHDRLRLEPEAQLIGSVGQLVQRKGHDLVVAAAGRLAGSLPKVHWLVAGSRHSQKAEAIEYEAALHRSARAAGLEGRLHFLGRLEAIESFLPELCLLVHSARQEPLGRVLLEAAACGVACVATDVGGTREIFPPQSQAARLVPAGDAAALARNVLKLMSNPRLRREMGRVARERAETSFDVRTTAALTADHYRAVFLSASRRN